MNEKLTLIQKFNEAKKRLASANLKKSGNNSFQKFDYFELGDFLPTIIQAEQELGYANLISFPTIDGIVTALLTVCDATSTDTLSFMSPIADASTKGASPIQAIGSMHTYMRRYLYVMAYEIAEHDGVDGVDQKDTETKPKYTAKPDTAPNPAPTAPPKQPTMPVDNKQAIIDCIGSLIYPERTKAGNGPPDGFCYEIYSTAMVAYNKLDAKVKKLTDLNIDQLKDMAQKMDIPPVLR